MKAQSLCLLLACVAVASFGQTSPIKTLSPQTVEAYQNGSGNGLAMPAELNGYPGPRHVLDLADKLNLTAEQQAAVKAIYDRMHAEAVRIGGEILDLEGKLDRRFSQGAITEAELTRLTREIAERQGRLRFVHLDAHLAAKKLLTAAQIDEYNRLRGHSH